MDVAEKTPTVLIGVTGCIAAYKACELVRILQKSGCRVKVVMTENATRFVGPATFKALTREPVATGLFDMPGDSIHHISLAQEADIFAIVPATANIIAKIATGICDDLLTTTALATEAPLLVAPAMNVHMYQNPRFEKALKALEDSGATIVSPDAGYLACGEIGEGRLASVEAIADAIMMELRRSRDLAGKRIMITAGGTYEPIDPVRFIGNRSSGKTGFAIADAARKRGAEVILITGPASLRPPSGVEVIQVETAQEMFAAANKYFKDSDLAIFSAAVADFRPDVYHDQKIKKRKETSSAPDDAGCEANSMTLACVENTDILKTLAAEKGNTFVVGYAAETEQVLTNARAKLKEKNADIIVANDVSDPSLGFATDDNRVWLISAHEEKDLGITSKHNIAEAILNAYRETMDRA
jgi:phosphopantothenoylcysteine decarboxylase / phosphopantothenate---cysteine ligase